jgi:hypothetical protein
VESEIQGDRETGYRSDNTQSERFKRYQIKQNDRNT